MTLNLEDVTGNDAYERMKWCEEAVKQLKERSPRKARIWWERDCVHPNWLECLPKPRDKILQFRERLEAEMYEWAEAASDLFAKEETTEAEERKEARRLLERSLNWKRRRLELVRQCQSIPEPERTKRGSDLWWDCGHTYLMEKRRWVRKEQSFVLASYPSPLLKIGATNRPWKIRRDELRREGCLTMEKYATIIAFELEEALHDYFDHFRVRRTERQKGQRKNIRGERFRLATEEIERFTETVAKVERWVLVATEARLELEVMKMEAALARMQS
jgi:T5orf172 domain